MERKEGGGGGGGGGGVRRLHTAKAVLGVQSMRDSCLKGRRGNKRKEGV